MIFWPWFFSSRVDDYIPEPKDDEENYKESIPRKTKTIKGADEVIKVLGAGENVEEDRDIDDLLAKLKKLLGNNECKEMLVDFINNIPSKNHWTPVTKAFPSIDKNVLVKIVGEFGTYVKIGRYVNNGRWLVNDCVTNNIQFWM